MKVQRYVAALIICMILSTTLGCSKQVAKEEARLYSMQAYEEGSREARNAGRGRNGRLLEDLQAAFSQEHIRLTNETFTEDDIGNLTYQYRINNDASQFITVYIYQSPEARRKGMDEIYGAQEGDVNVGGGHNLIYSDRETSIVYTSTGDKTDNYYSLFKKIAPQLLKEHDGRAGS